MSSTRFTLLSCVALALAVSACAKDPLNKNGKPTGEDLRPVRLELESASSMVVAFEQAAAIKVKAVYADDGSPVAARSIKFTISGAAGGSTLTAASVTTDANGKAPNQIVAGTNRVEFKVVISTANATDVTVAVKVDGSYQGQLRVQYTYSDVIPLVAITTRIHAGAPSCSSINLASPPANVGTKVATSVGSFVTFDNLAEGAIFTVTATATSGSGDAVAVGCVTAPAIVGRSSVTAIVPLRLSSPKVIGEYDFSTKLHTNEALPGDIGEVVSTLDYYLNHPEQAIADEIYAYYMEQMGVSLSEAKTHFYILVLGLCLTGDDSFCMSDSDGDGILDEVVEAKVLQNLPPSVVSAIQIGGDITNLLTNLTVGGTLDITGATESPTNTFALAGNWEWNDFLFRWQNGAECDGLSDACCGRRQFSGAEMGISPVGASFSGTAVRTTATDRIELDLSVPPHKLDIQYGKLILAAINYFVLPELTGQSSLSCAMESFIGCEAGGSFVCGGGPAAAPKCGCDYAGKWVSDNLGLPADAGESVCRLALAYAQAELTEQLEGLTYNGSDDNYFMMDIEGLLADTDRDLQTDLIDAANVGRLYLDASTNPEPADFTGDMYGEIVRTTCASEAGCGEFDSCQVRRDVLDDCAARTVCVTTVGAGAAGAACSQGAQCQSGTCIPGATAAQGKCFAACAQPADCPGSMSCGTAEVSNGAGVTVDVGACGM